MHKTAHFLLLSFMDGRLKSFNTAITIADITQAQPFFYTFSSFVCSTSLHFFYTHLKFFMQWSPVFAL